MYNILVCDDEKDIVEELGIYLSAEGYQVTKAYNGQEACEKLKTGDVQLVLMDIMMPVMDGLTATKTIRSLERQDAKTIPIIAMTANAFREDAEKCMEAGMNAHLAKPLDDKKIRQTIREELMRSHRDRDGG